MLKFKVGDKVTILDEPNTTDMGTIEGYDQDSGKYLVKFEQSDKNREMYYNEEQLDAYNK